MSVVKVLLLLEKWDCSGCDVTVSHHQEALSFHVAQCPFYRSTTMLNFPHIAVQSQSDYITFSYTNTPIQLGTESQITVSPSR